jgi:hypothetical protein
MVKTVLRKKHLGTATRLLMLKRDILVVRFKRVSHVTLRDLILVEITKVSSLVAAALARLNSDSSGS